MSLIAYKINTTLRDRILTILIFHFKICGNTDWWKELYCKTYDRSRDSSNKTVGLLTVKDSGTGRCL